MEIKDMSVADKVRTFLSSLPVLEPLCKATQSTLTPLPLWDTDFLEIGLDEEGRRFIVRATKYDKVTVTPRCKYCGEQNILAEFYAKLKPKAGYFGGIDRVRVADGWTSNNARVGWLKKIPEYKQDKDHPERYHIACTDFSCLVIAHQWKEDRIVWRSKEAETMYKYLLTRFLVQTKNSIIGAEFKINKKLPKLPDTYIKHPKLPNADYQDVGVAMSYGSEAFALFMQQGTGKTPVSISRMCAEARATRQGMFGKKRMMLVLIICPMQARSNWQKEIERFATVPGKTVVMRGNKFRRMRAVIDVVRQDADCEFAACITSFTKVGNTSEAINMVPWDLVIVDESHYIKTPSADRSKEIRKLRDCSARRMVLTGTPITNSPMDLWSQFEFLGDGLSGFLDYKEFKKFYGRWEKVQGSSGIEKLTALQNLPLIQERLSRMSFSISKEEAGLKLPPKVYDIYDVVMSAKQQEFYAKLQNELAIEIAEAEAEAAKKGKVLTANHILTRLLRLAQISHGYVKWNAQYDQDGEPIKGSGRIEQIDGDILNRKCQAILDILEEDTANDPNSKCIIWAVDVESIQLIERRLKTAGIDVAVYYGQVKEDARETAVYRFNHDPKCRVFLANPASASEAINLVGYDYENAIPKCSTYADHVVYFSCDWSPTKRSQSEDRAHRRGARGPAIRITDLQVTGSIDDEIRQVVQLKIENADAVQDIKGLLERVLQTKYEDDDE